MEQVGNNWKTIVIGLNDGTHAEMRLKFRYDNITQADFFRCIIEAYVTDNKLMRQLIKELNTKISNRSKVKMRKDEKKMEKETELFGLSEDEIKDIYDQIENTGEE